MALHYVTLSLLMFSTVMSALTGYFFYLSNNGELRKILIKKFVTQSVFLGTLSMVLPDKLPVASSVIMCLTLMVYCYWKFQLQIYLINVKKGGK